MFFLIIGNYSVSEIWLHCLLKAFKDNSFYSENYVYIAAPYGLNSLLVSTKLSKGLIHRPFY